MPSFTFAVIGRDESATLAGVLAEAQAAAQPGDTVVFVDSASRDDSAAIARTAGIEVIAGPAGKGRAMSVAIAVCRTRYICFVDADLFQWTVNIPQALRAAAVSTGADMVVGGFRDDRRRVVMPFLYWPLVDALVPEYGRACDPTPMSGQRVFDPSLLTAELPGGYGAETHLNLMFAAAGHRIETCDLAELRGPLRGYSNLVQSAAETAAAILDHAVAAERLSSRLRVEWDRWVAGVLDVLARSPPPGAPDRLFIEEMREAAARPLPATRAYAAQPNWA